jgi:hypothetical protein
MRSTSTPIRRFATLATLAWLLAICPTDAADAQDLIARITLKAARLDGLTVLPSAQKVTGSSPAERDRIVRELRRELEGRTDLRLQGVCRGEVFRVAVETRPPVPGQWVSVAIDGYPGSQRFLQFGGEASTRLVHVVAATAGRPPQSTSLKVPLRDCEVTPAMRVRSRFNPYHPYTVDFTVESDAKSDSMGSYHWNFGDGAVATTSDPYVSHSYFERLDGSVPYQTFVVTVSREPRSAIGRRPVSRIERSYAVTLQNNYYPAKKAGILQPPAMTSGRTEAHGLQRVGSYRIRNLEAEPIIFQTATIENRPCNVPTSTSPTSTTAPTTPAAVLFQGGVALELAGQPSAMGPSLRAALDLKRSMPSLPVDAIVIPPRMPDGAGLTRNDLRRLDGSSRSRGLATLPTVPGRPGGPATPVIPSSGVVVIPGGQMHEGFLTIDTTQVPQGTCEVGYHLKGASQSGRPAYANLYFTVRDNASLRSRVTDGGTRTFLLELYRRGLVRGATVTQEDLYRLERRGKIQRTSRGWEIR